MSSKLLDGKWLAAQFHRSIKDEVTSRAAVFGRPPGLGVILVGDNPASKAYVGNKQKIATNCGFATFDTKLTNEATANDVASAIRSYNNDPRVDGILLQLPLPKHLNSNALLDLIDPKKDADGLHPLNQGLLARGEGHLRPCTPLGSMKLIDLALSKYDAAGEVNPEQIPVADLTGKKAVVIGRSILVGKPVALLLLERNATVTMAHSKTKDLAAVVKEADIVVAAVGVAHLVKREWVKPGAIVIDVGMNRLPTGELTGDVDFKGVSEVCGAITPVPGGVGPMTVTMLIYNTLKGFLKTNA
jgi:methylenetetrahydrofolate dehydrogenase (NADP+) / methenyltetrahydrofolate cyclohydrolase